MEPRYVELPASTTTGELVAEITTLSDDPAVDGILLQHPVPDHVDERAAFEAIAPNKDVDGVTMHSFAATAFNEPGFHSCTPGGILRLLDAYDVPLSGQHAIRGSSRAGQSDHTGPRWRGPDDNRGAARANAYRRV